MNVPESKRRWFRPTFGWLLIASSAVTVFLLLSDKYQWCAFSQFRNFTTIFVLWNTGVACLLILLWLTFLLLLRRRLQFTIRSLLLLAVAAALPLGWIRSRMRDAEWQRQGVALVERLGGDVHLGEHSSPDLWNKMHRLFPDAVFEEVSFVEFRSHKIQLSSADLSEIVRLLPHIQILFLKSNGITDENLEPLRGLKELAWLSLADNRITDNGLEHLASAKQLGALELDNTSVTDAGLEILRGHEFWYLCLNGTRVTDSGLSSIRGHRLHALALNNTEISDAGLAHLDTQEELQQLLLSGTKVTGSGLARFSHMKDLRELNLSKTKITDKGVQQLENVTTLCWLDLSGTQISDAGLDCLKGMDQIQQLKLDNTNITDRALEKLAAMWADRFGGGDKVSLLGTKTTKAGVKKLQQAWPNCTIER
jgi:hypothetical protein